MSSAGKDENVDRHVRSLATDITTKSVSEVLLQLKGMLDKKSLEDARELAKFKQDLYSTGILAYCSAALNYNYDSIQGNYQTAAQMAEILSTCCVGFGTIKSQEIFKFLPSVAENLISLAKCIMERAIEEKEQAWMIRQFKKVLDSVCWLLKEHSQLIPLVLQSKYYEKIQLCDNEEIGAIALSFLKNVISTNCAFFSDLGPGALNSMLDDIMYKLGCSSNPAVGSAATKTLLLIASKDSSIAELIPASYQGLDALLKNDWKGKGFDAELVQLLDLLYPGVTYQETPLDSCERKVKAACTIQAAWRSFQTRKRIKKLPKAISTLQRSFRERRRRQELRSEQKRAEEELRLHVRLKRQRALREFRERQLHLLEIVPASQVDRFLDEVERRAALIIQRFWRGHRERRTFQLQKEALRQFKAAVTIQRAALRFLKRRRAQRYTLSPWKGPKGLTDTRRTELKEQLDEYIALHPAHSVTIESCRALHRRTQEMLQHHLRSRDTERRAEQHRQALLAQINTDIELLINAPSLRDSTGLDSDVFLSRSAPVASRARQSHHTMLQATRYPWWKRLKDEFLNVESAPIDKLDIQLETLYFGGS